jgi:Kef-type K+ transport system membrane component KefB
VTLATIGFIAVMILVVRPVAARVVSGAHDPHPGAIALVFIAVAAAAYVTDAIGVHAIFGAFMLGVMIPSHSRLAEAVQQRFERVVTLLLLPAFFALTGLRTEIRLVTGADWVALLMVVAVATAGKFGSTFLAARWSGLQWRMSAALGVLMNTRGLMEIIVLNVGLALGVISPRMFTIFVLMAIITTLATTPVLKALIETNHPKQ